MEEEEPEPNPIGENSHIELSNIEKESAKANFLFYDKAKAGFVERFELPMVLSGKYMNCISKLILQTIL